jgi:stage II sporulation protein AB (anti-sigma F factor)
MDGASKRLAAAKRRELRRSGETLKASFLRLCSRKTWWMPPPDESNRQAAARIFRGPASAMRRQPPQQIARRSGIKRSIPARQDVNGGFGRCSVRKNLDGIRHVNVLRLSIPPLPRFAGTVRRAFWDFAALHHVTEPELESFLFAVGEAIANAIQHAGTGKAIEIRIEMEKDSMVATIRDWGRGFAPPGGRVPLPSIFAEEGRGLAIMQRFSDFLEVESKPGRGTVVTLGRHVKDAQELVRVS